MRKKKEEICFSGTTLRQERYVSLNIISYFVEQGRGCPAVPLVLPFNPRLGGGMETSGIGRAQKSGQKTAKIRSQGRRPETATTCIQ